MSFFSGAGAGLISGIGQAIGNSQNKREAERNRGFQERMSNSAYKRSMADMRSAGLNPMLAYKQGGASTPSGAQADIGNVGEKAVASALQAKSVKQQIKLLDEQIDNVKAQTRKTNREADILGPKSSLYNWIEKNVSSAFQTSKKVNKKLQKSGSLDDPIELKAGY